MTVTGAVLAFTVAAGLLTITPGLDTALVLRTATVEGPRRAALAGIGICCGTLIWGALVALGLGALLAASTIAYTVLRWIGAAYLCYLGLGMLLYPRTEFAIESPAATRTVTTTPHGWFVRGLLTNLLNPKVGVFYVTFLPQFVPAHVNVALFTFSLAAIHAVQGAAWFALLIGATQQLARRLRRPRVVRTLDRLTGLVLVGFGVRLLVDVRR